MHSNTWKGAETVWGELLGGQRVPVTGRARGHAPDVAHERYAIEIKKVGHGKRNPYLTSKMLDAYDQAVKAGRELFAKDGRPRAPIVGIERTNDSRRIERYVLISLEDFVDLTDGGVNE